MIGLEWEGGMTVCVGKGEYVKRGVFWLLG